MPGCMVALWEGHYGRMPMGRIGIFMWYFDVLTLDSVSDKRIYGDFGLVIQNLIQVGFHKLQLTFVETTPMTVSSKDMGMLWHH